MKQRLMRVALLSAFAAFNMHASLILVGSQQAQGGGFGNVPNILTVQEVGQDDGSESGCIAGGPGSSVISGTCLTQTGSFTGGDEVNPTNTNFNQLIAFNGTGAGDIRIGFNAAEPGNDLSITFTNLILTLYGSTGTPMYSTSGLSCNGQPGCTQNGADSITLTSTQSGIGNFGFIFGLDATQAAQLNAAGTGRLGLAASFTGYAGAQETFYLVAGPGGGGGGAEIPEPSSLFLLAGALPALIWCKKRFGQQS